MKKLVIPRSACQANPSRPGPVAAQADLDVAGRVDVPLLDEAEHRRAVRALDAEHLAAGVGVRVEVDEPERAAALRATRGASGSVIEWSPPSTIGDRACVERPARPCPRSPRGSPRGRPGSPARRRSRRRAAPRARRRRRRGAAPAGSRRPGSRAARSASRGGRRRGRRSARRRSRRPRPRARPDPRCTEGCRR